MAALSPELDALSAFTWLEETERLITLRTALPALNLVATRLVMREAEGQGFELILDAVSTSAYLPLKRLIGEQMTVGLRQADGSYAPRHGYVTEAAQLGSDGGLARYRLVMAPWLAVLQLRRDSFVFQDKTVPQILDDIFADYPQAQWRWELADASALRTRSLCIQYRESDWAFVQRLLASEGLSWHIEHLGEEDAATADEQGKARHVMVITDAGAERADLGLIRFASLHPTAVVAGLEDPITGFAAQRSLTPNAVALGSWNYRSLAGASAELASALDLGEVPWLEQYDGSGAYRFADTQAAERAARLALGALELQAKRFAGQGGARVLRAGAQFQLIDHPLYGANTTAPSYAAALTASHPRPDNAFTVLAVEHHVANNLGDQAAELLKQTALAKGGYRNQFQAVPAAAPVLPRPARAPTAPYLLTARVVGLQDEALTTERDHRVKVQFHFQRGSAPNPGGLPHAYSADETGNAPGNDQSGTWVRVATPAAGANWGAVWVPRIGSEVAVQFIEGDIDRPIIAGGLSNGDQPPPFAAGVDAGVNHPGVLAGLHSRTLDGQHTQQWVVDDAPGQLRTRLATTPSSSGGGSELSLGHLIHQSPTSAQRGAWRGSGFEANTQGWASLRAGAGLLVSTQARSGTYGSAQGPQMDAAEALAQLQSASELGQRLSQAAQAIGAQALSSTEEGQDLVKLHQALDPSQDGRHPDQVNGQDAKIPTDGRDPSQGEPVPAFAQPAVVLDSAAAQLLATPASVQQFSGQRLSQVVQQDLQTTAAHTASIAAGQTASLYAHQGGLQVKAANGPVSLRAHTDELKLLADQSVTITSVNDEIRISANSKIELIAGQSGITLEGGNITVTTPGSFAVKGATHGFLGGGSQAASLPALPTGQVSQAPVFMELNLHDEWLMPVAGAAYTVVFEDGTQRQGHLDADGHARLEGVPNLPARVFYGEDPAEPEARVALPANDFQPSAQTNEEAEANIKAYLERAEAFWAEQATTEQREVRAELNDEGTDDAGENLWHYLDEAQQQSLQQELQGDGA
ncbi:type VI secretion system tip protein VgrG [Ideonella sp. B7]|uniref:type VI secretion system Vgr family protein n=1 Tax=Ideonella benzenivorans TaxID=2831643 RepID=UPI001CEC7C7E|nr:type VI secretion system tip protein TssI/VgrG [Ideonella benzenivorans]MCA6216261.1 type VI secretion system tip protein VgrG [Ideonella benzenivorans]